MKPAPKQPSMHVRQTLQLYVQATLRYKMHCLLALTLPISNVVLGVLVPFFASKVLAGLAGHGTAPWPAFWCFAVSTVVGAALNTIGIRRCMVLQAEVLEDLHNSMFSKLLERSVGFYSNQIGGKLVSDAIDYITAYGQLSNAIIINLSGFTLSTLIGLGIVLASNWAIGLALCVLLVGLTYWTIVETNRRSRIRNERQMITKRLVSHLSDNIVNAITVKTFAQEAAEEAHNQAIDTELKKARVTDWQQVVTNEGRRMSVLLLAQVALVAVLIVITSANPHMLATSIFAFTYTLMLINRFIAINTVAKQIEDNFLQAAPMTAILQQQPEIKDAPNAQALTVKHGEITWSDVAFRYADSAKDDYIFKHLNMTIQSGQKVGLVGHSGGGKSTLTRLLLRFDDISTGSICIDGQDIAQVTQTSLRQQISYVPQEPLLFHRSIRENIAYGNPKATDRDVERAAKLAYAHDFITKLPDGYNTIVGERGVKLSGGQRQRVAIARAILKNSPILVLDEATSALDSESEKAIQKALRELMDNKTAVVIAHRLSTIQKMDRILVLEDGRIVEDGDHKSLLQKRNGRYAKLWAHQSGGFIEE